MMSSFVRYSIAVYVGLLMAGTAGNLWSRSSEGSESDIVAPEQVMPLAHASTCPKAANLPDANLHPCTCQVDDRRSAD